MNLDEAAAWLDGLIDVERTPRDRPIRLSLEPVERLLERIGRPERALSVIHVAGSKGKGSTALLAEAVLSAAGERVGTFTSPHLERWTERFRVAGREIPAVDLAAAVSAIRPHVEALLRDPGAPDPSFFDATTAAAFWIFREARVDRAVIEVGLGGRLDSTNVVDPAVSCITSIELEHVERLGPTLAAIAGEKAGIVKPGRAVVVGALPAEALDVVVSRASERRAPLAVLGREFFFDVLGRPTLEGVDLEIRDGSFRTEARLSAPGRHQAANAALAVAAVRRLGAHGDDALAAAVRSGLGAAELPGRIEVLAERPLVVVDAAHTEASARALAAALEGVSRRRTRLVISISSDKRLEAILAVLLPLADEVFVTRAEPVRSLDPAEVARAVRVAAPGVVLHAVPNPFVAVRAASEGLGVDDLLLATGSVYLAGLARRVLRERLST